MIKQTQSNLLMIRKAKLDELGLILEIQMKAFNVYTDRFAAEKTPPLNESIEQIQNDFKHKTILVACLDEKIIGSVRYDINLGVCHFDRLSVDPDYQKQGVGQQLILNIESSVAGISHKIYLETGLLASELIAFYSRLGYSGEAILTNHYGNFDWIVFSKFLIDSSTEY